MTRREALTLFAGATAGKLFAQSRPDGFRAYSESPRLLLRPARLRLLRRERERQSLRWEQFERLWSGNAPFPELGWVAALRYQIAQDDAAGKAAVSWGLRPSANDVRQIALICDWCSALIDKSDQPRLFGKLRAAATGPAPATLAQARDMAMAAVVLSESQPDVAEKTLRTIFDTFWTGSFIPSIREARVRVPNAEAYAMMELLHTFRDNLNFDLRETFPEWFRDYPLIHVLAHYPAPWPASENEFRIPADREIQSKGPDLTKATLSRAAELAMVAFDANSGGTQLVQGFLMNDRFVMRGSYGIPYEFLWANPYQPGLSYYHVPLAQHDEIGGQLFVRSTWEDDASWVGYFEGRLQLFSQGVVKAVDPRVAHEPMDIEEATVFFAKDANRFKVPKRDNDEAVDDVFVVGLDPHRNYHVEVDGEEMVEDQADPGGILFLPAVPAGVQVRLGPASY
ncbi:MAG: hypothetical protein KGN84_10720 [Acidobacteriota bacterium]|nr:hypothetical protein [Acidobacteriota bacterium]